jgi:DNA-binding XRE family transcriptional regulator
MLSSLALGYVTKWRHFSLALMSPFGYYPGMKSNKTPQIKEMSEMFLQMATQLKSRRENIDLTQDALAKKAGVARQQINAIERGKVKGPRLTTFEKIYMALEDEEKTYKRRLAKRLANA